jgi:hypothetical protein
VSEELNKNIFQNEVPWTEELDLVKEDNIFARTVMKGIKLDFVCFAVKYSWKKGTRYSLTYSLKYYFFSEV